MKEERARITRESAEYVPRVEWVKRMTGLTAALFCVLLFSAFAQFILEIDVEWYNSLSKPSFMLSPFGFRVTVCLMYACVVAVITRLVVGKHFFPSTVILALTAVFALVCLFCIFRARALVGGAFSACLLVAASLALGVRFAFKDGVLALVYAPVFLFNAYCLVVMCFLALNN